MTVKFKCEIELNQLSSRAGRGGVWLCPAACPTHSEDTRPRAGRAGGRRPACPLPAVALQVGGFGEEVGTVHVFKSEEMMFKHKNKFFHFQKHYLFIIILHL